MILFKAQRWLAVLCVRVLACLAPGETWPQLGRLVQPHLDLTMARSFAVADERLKELADLGREMRKAQVRYFRSHEIGDLEVAKKLERRFDDFVEEVLGEGKDGQRTLFGGG